MPSPRPTFRARRQAATWPRSDVLPSYEEVEFDGHFALEVRGLWKMENDFMGGPFYSLTIVDEARGRLLTVEGYAYAPISTSSTSAKGSLVGRRCCCSARRPRDDEGGRQV